MTRPAPHRDPSATSGASPMPGANRARVATGRGDRGVDAGGSVRADARSRRIAALVDLLDDPSHQVERQVIRELVRADRRALPALLAAAKDPAPRRRARARLVLERRRFEGAWRRLIAALARPDIDLESGLLRLSALAPDGGDPRPVRRRLARLARAAGERIGDRTDDLSGAYELVEELCGEWGFAGAEESYHHPDHVWLHRAVEGRRGLPLTLAAIHILVARRIGVRATAVPLPGHVLLRLHSGRRSLLVDPFHGGVVRSRRECRQYLAERGLPFRSSWFADADDRHLLRRQVWNLHRSFRERGWDARAARLRAAGGLLEGLRGPVTTADAEGPTS